MNANVPIALLASVAISFAMLTAPQTSLAQSPPTTRADQLFKEGRDAMGRSDYPAACSKFAESNSVMPRVGTLVNLAGCQEKQGKLVAALSTYEQAIQLAEVTNDERRQKAVEQRDALRTRIPKLTIDASDLPPAARVFLDGELVERDKSRDALYVDPAISHTIEVMCHGRERTTTSVVLNEGEAKAVSVSVGEAVSKPGPDGASARSRGAAAPGPTARARTRPPPQRATPREEESSSTGRTLAYVAGGVGIVGVLVGAVTGGMLMSKRSTIDSHCDAARRCDQEGLDAVDSFKGLVPVNKAAWVIGIVGLGAGTVLFFTATPSSDSAATQGFAVVAKGTLP